ncbi:hypothetical protein RFI_27845, partial [Reticulomyxa filosa]
FFKKKKKLKIGCFKEGVALLLRHKSLELFQQMLLSSEMTFLSNQVLKIVYTIAKTCARHNGDIFDSFFRQWALLSEVILAGVNAIDISTRESCILLIGVLCSNDKFLCQLFEEKQVTILTDIVNQSSSKVSEDEQLLVVASLHALTDVFLCQGAEDSKVQKIQKTLIKQFGGIEKLFTFIQLPFDDLRFGAFRLIDQISKHPWALQIVYSTAGLYEYLTNRRDADIKLAMEWKYAVLQSIYKNPLCSKTLTSIHQEQLKEHLQQGVVFNTSQPSDTHKRKDNKVNQSGAVKIIWDERY